MKMVIIREVSNIDQYGWSPVCVLQAQTIETMHNDFRPPNYLLKPNKFI